jgi:O-6-methylguanine DNA methyltransferase
LSDFASRVRAAVRRIPAGRVSTYGDIALMAGRPRAHRAVGTLMSRGGDPSLPAHRVIAAGGRLGGFGGHPELKAQRLRAEGLIVINGRVRDFAAVRWEPSKGKGQRAKGKGAARKKGKGTK